MKSKILNLIKIQNLKMRLKVPVGSDIRKKLNTNDKNKIKKTQRINKKK